MKIVIGSMNKGKVNEMKRVLESVHGVEVVGLADLGVTVDAPEDRDTFAGNACQKAGFYAGLTGLPVVADDSGLEVELLDNRPGVYSARWTGEHADDETNNRMLVSELARKGISSSPARYVSAMALVFPDGRDIVVEGELKGVIRNTPHGDKGFSYDPFFYLPDGRTVADIDVDEKNAISHRGVALRKLMTLLAAGV